MTNEKIWDEEAQTATNLIKQGLSRIEAAESMGLSKSALNRRLERAARLELFPTKAPVPVAEGQKLSKTTVQYDGKGNVIQEWRRLEPLEQDLREFVDSLSSQVEGKAKFPIFIPEETDDMDLMKEIALNDLHIGKMCWGAETGKNYDSKTAQLAAINAVYIALKGKTYGKVTLLYGGDTLHADNRSNKTEKSGNVLDVDNRYQKVVGIARDTLVQTVEIASKHAAEVELIIIPGNHDWMTATCLKHILDAYYRDEDRISVDMSPAPRICKQWGKNMLVYAHGDCVKAERWPEIAASEFPKQWYECPFRRVHLGHIHTRKSYKTYPVNSLPGITVEYLSALCPPDAWHVEMGYVGKHEACNAFTYHSEWGCISEETISLERALQYQTE